MFINGKEVSAYKTEIGNQKVLMSSVILKPGQTQNYEFEVYGAKGQIDDAKLQITPGVRSTGIGTLRKTGCY